jgi:HTH-type transcriptional regulator / antitoxin HipB
MTFTAREPRAAVISRAQTPAQLGLALRAARQGQGLTQSKLAALSGQRQERISRIEAGRSGTSIASIFAILAALGLELVLDPRSTAVLESKRFS